MEDKSEKKLKAKKRPLPEITTNGKEEGSEEEHF